MLYSLFRIISHSDFKKNLKSSSVFLEEDHLIFFEPTLLLFKAQHSLRVPPQYFVTKWLAWTLKFGDWKNAKSTSAGMALLKHDPIFGAIQHEKPIPRICFSIVPCFWLGQRVHSLLGNCCRCAILQVDYVLPDLETGKQKCVTDGPCQTSKSPTLTITTTPWHTCTYIHILRLTEKELLRTKARLKRFYCLDQKLDTLVPMSSHSLVFCYLSKTL